VLKLLFCSRILLGVLQGDCHGEKGTPGKAGEVGKKEIKTAYP